MASQISSSNGGDSRRDAERGQCCGWVADQRLWVLASATIQHVDALDCGRQHDSRADAEQKVICSNA